MNKFVLSALTVSVLLTSSVPLFAEEDSYPWLTVRRYEGVTDTKEAARVVQEGLVPLISKLPGFIAYNYVDAGNGVVISVSVYTNKGAEEESNRVAEDFAKERMTHLYPTPPLITAGHVVATAPKGVSLSAEEESHPWLAFRRYEGVTDTKKAAQVVQEGFVPLISKLPGFISYYWVDAGNGVMISVSTYTNKEAEEETIRIAHDFVKQHMAPLLPNPPRVTHGHVVAAPKK